MTLSIIVGGEEMQLGLMELKKEMEQYTHWICASELPCNGVLLPNLYSKYVLLQSLNI
jgi:hypothetical protein